MSTERLPPQPKRLVGYFPSWGIHAHNYHVGDIPADRLSHVIYAFADVSKNGTCVSINENDDKINFSQLAQLKRQHPKLQTLISVGGASHSANFPDAVSTSATRQLFARSCVQFMQLNGFDGIDIDWEYPAAADANNFTALLMELRSELDTLSATDRRSYMLTIAAPAGVSHNSNLQLNLIHRNLDWINLMAYDFAVASSKVTDFVAPLKPYDLLVAKHAASNVDATVQAYLTRGVPAGKLVLGTRFIGTGWLGAANTNSGLYQNNEGPAKGTWDAVGKPTGSFGYQDLEQNYIRNGSRFWHPDAEVPWVFDPTTGIMISYEDPQSLRLKAGYAMEQGLAGVMIWELSADDRRHTLLESLADLLGLATGL